MRSLCLRLGLARRECLLLCSHAGTNKGCGSLTHERKMCSAAFSHTQVRLLDFLKSKEEAATALYRVSVFGVSAESMQCSHDSRGNSVPTILLSMQRHLYSQGGLKAEGVFRINAENGQEMLVREQLNKGVVPHGVDLHCLAGLIKAWFRELPSGVLDSLTPEQVMHCNTEKDCYQLVRALPPTEAALLDWAINLMADVVEHEHYNKMNARNIAMVFAPNMTQMSDPLTALMHAVQVMNLLKTLILKVLREREEAAVGGISPSFSSQSSQGYHDEEMHSHAREITSDDEYSSGSCGLGDDGNVDDDDDNDDDNDNDNDNDDDNDDDDDDDEAEGGENYTGDSTCNLTQLSFQNFDPEVSSCRELILFDMKRITPHEQIGDGDLEV